MLLAMCLCGLLVASDCFCDYKMDDKSLSSSSLFAACSRVSDVNAGARRGVHKESAVSMSLTTTFLQCNK